MTRQILTFSWLWIAALCLISTQTTLGQTTGFATESLPLSEPEVLPPGISTMIDDPVLDPDRHTPADAVQVGSGDSELIRERYANGKIRIEREVVQDEDENYVKHGSYKMWDPAGNLIVEGQYRHNTRHGVWRRWYSGNEVRLLKTPPFNQFTAPFVSQASFRDGQLHGDWIIYDSKHRKITTWTFVDGRRDGKSTWWYASGHKMRELSYREGEIHGDLLEWDGRGELVTRDKYEEGRRLVQQIDNHNNGQKKTEGTILQPRLILDKADDWWNCRLATYSREGNPEKHGKWYAWYPNGQKRIEGEYKNDKPVGQFIWWHQNGQKSLVANYDAGQKSGQWTWWHESGQKSIQGEYTADSPINQWTWWHQSGRVAQRIDFSENGTPNNVTPGLIAPQDDGGNVVTQPQLAPSELTPDERPRNYRSVLRNKRVSQ